MIAFDGTLRRLAIVIAVLVLPAKASASTECRTVAERNFSDMNVDLAVGSSGERVRALDIVEGEVVCVRIRRTASGVHEFDVVPDGNHEDTLRIEVQRMRRRAAVRQVQIVISVRAANRHGLGYRAALSLGAGRDVREVLSSFIEGGGEQAHGWPLSDRIRHHVLLFDLRLEPPRPRLERPFPNFIGISFVSSLHVNQLDALNAEFARNGLGAVSNVQPYLGFAFDGGIGRFRATWDLEAGLHRPGDATSPSVGGTFIALHAGFAIFRESGFALFPMLGIAGGDQWVEIEPNRLAIFPGQLGATEDVRKNLGWFLPSLGSEYRLPLTAGTFSRGGLLFGARVGYAFQFSQSDWLRETPALPSLAGGPPVDTSGPYVRLGVGWYEE